MTFLQGQLTQSLSDQGNLDTIKQQENYSNKISTEPVTGADTDTELHYENIQELNVADVYTDSHIKTQLVKA